MTSTTPYATPLPTTYQGLQSILEGFKQMLKDDRNILVKTQNLAYYVLNIEQEEEMATIETKYNLGDVVYNAFHYHDSYFEKCPDCDGTGKWKVEGKDLHVGCKTCNEHYWQEDTAGKVRKFKYFPRVRKLTIGQIRATIGYGPEVRYMCEETGTGSGTLWRESILTKDKELAEECAKILAEKKNAGEEVELEDLLAQKGCKNA